MFQFFLLLIGFGYESLSFIIPKNSMIFTMSTSWQIIIPKNSMIFTMSTSWQTVSVFVSSTFNDMHAERDYLVKRVFPELREWCEQRKLRLIDIDLRWGITETDATSKNVVRVCLNRIDECRPFFLCFLGQRRGWVPAKEDITSDTCTTFPDLKKYIGSASVTEMEILHAVINPMNKRERSHSAFFYLREPSYLEDLPNEPRFIRNTYTNEGIADPSVRMRMDTDLKDWRENFIPKTGRSVNNYTVTWNPDENTPELAMPLQCPSQEIQNQKRWNDQWRELGISPHTLDLTDDSSVAYKARKKNDEITRGRLSSFRCDDKELAAVILNDLKSAIAERFPEHMLIRGDTPLQKELEQQEQFLELNCSGFIKREGDFDSLDAYISLDSHYLFVLTAPGGIGKTMLLANWIRSYPQRYRSKKQFFYRFIGASDGSTTTDAVLRSLLTEMKETGLLQDEIPVDPEELRNTFFDLLTSIGSRGRCVIVIDALNQLESGLRDLHWLPKKLPSGIQMIVSFKLEGSEAEGLASHLRESLPETFHEIQPFKSCNDRKKLVSAYLDQFLKQLDDTHIQSLVDSLGAKNPLFLKVVLSEIRVYGSFANLGDKIREDFGTNPVAAFGAVLKRLENDPTFTTISPETTVPLFFGFISHARGGLSENELIDLFKREISYEKEAIRDSIRFLLRQMRPFLAVRVGRYDFFYESFRTAAIDRYEGIDTERNQRLSTEWHRLLADYFEQLPAWVSQKDNIPSLRRAAQLPYHLAWAGKSDYLAEMILKYELLETIVFGLGPQAAIEDISFVLSSPVRLEKKGIPGKNDGIQLIKGALRLAAHVLAQKPDQLPSQLVGRLLKSEDPVVRKFIDTINQFNRYPWLRPVTLSLTPPSGPLIRTLVGHTNVVEAVAVTPDGRHIVSGSWDKTLKVWDLESGRELTILKGHTEFIKAVVITPDGKRVISGSQDKTLRVWDLENDRELAVLRGHTSYVNAVAITPDGKRVISGSMDKTLKVWDLGSSRELATFTGHNGIIKAVAVTPDNHRAVSGSGSILEKDGDKTLKVWDLESGRELATLKGHTGEINAVAVTPDGRRVISGSRDTTLKVWDLESGRELATFKGHTGDIAVVAVTPDGRRVVSGSGGTWEMYGDKTLKVWDLENGRELATFKGHTAEISAVAVTPDSRRVVSGSRGRLFQRCGDTPLKVWDLESGRELAVLQGHEDGITAVVITPDGKRVISGSQDKTLRVWDLENGRELAVLRGHTNYVDAVAITPDGKRVISGSWDKTLKVWDLESGRELTTLKGHTGFVKAVAVTPNGCVVISGSGDIFDAHGYPSLKVWDLESGRELAILEGFSKNIMAVAVTHDGKRVISGYTDEILKVWELESGRELAMLRGHTGSVNSVAVMPDGKRAVSGSDDRTLKVWDLESGRELGTLTGHTDYINSVAVTPDGNRAVSGSSDKTLKVWDLESTRQIDTLTSHTKRVSVVVVTLDGRRAVSGSDDTTLKVWDLESGRELVTLSGHTDSIKAVAITPDGRRAVSGSKDTTLKVWDLESGRELATLKGHTDWVRAVAVMPDGKRAVSGSDDRTLKVWDLESCRELTTLKGHIERISALVVTPDGRRVVSGSGDSTLSVWDIESGQELVSIAGHINIVLAVAVTLDGRRIVSGGLDHTLKVWDLESGQELATLKGHTEGVNSVAVTPDGRHIVSGSWDKTLKVWDLESGRELTTLKGHTDKISALIVTLDGRHVISGSLDTTLKVWDLENSTIFSEFYCDGPIQAFGYSDLLGSIITGDKNGQICILRFENGELDKD